MASGVEPPVPVVYPPRTAEETQLVLRHFLFSTVPGRRVPPIAKRDKKQGIDESESSMAKHIAAVFAVCRQAEDVKHRVTTSHAQELVSLSRQLRSDAASDAPQNRPLQLGTLHSRSVELHRYHQRRLSAASYFTPNFAHHRGHNDAVADAGASTRLTTTPGLKRDARRRLQASFRTYSTDPGDYVSTAAFEAAIEAEESRAVASFLASTAAGGESTPSPLRRRQRRAAPGAPRLRTAWPSYLPPKNDPSTTADIISSDTANIEIIDCAPHHGEARRTTTPSGEAPSHQMNSPSRSLSPTDTGKQKRGLVATQRRARRGEGPLYASTTRAARLAATVISAHRTSGDTLYCAPQRGNGSARDDGKGADSCGISWSPQCSESHAAPGDPGEGAELSKRTCLNDLKPPRRLMDVLREQIDEGASSALLHLSSKELMFAELMQKHGWSPSVMACFQQPALPHQATASPPRDPPKQMTLVRRLLQEAIERGRSTRGNQQTPLLITAGKDVRRP